MWCVDVTSTVGLSVVCGCDKYCAQWDVVSVVCGCDKYCALWDLVWCVDVTNTVHNGT